MPLHLHHGPQALPQQQALFGHIETHHGNDSKFWIVVPYRSSVPKTKVKLLEHMQSNLAMGQTVLTWEDFLLKITKNNFHRVHLADASLCLYLIHLLIQREFPKLQSSQFFPHLNEIYQFFIQIKSCGLSEEEAPLKFQEHLEYDCLLELLKRYNHELHALDYFDQGDLILQNLKLIQENKFKWPEGIQDLYISDIYPLKPGARELLRKLKNSESQLNIHVYYPENFDQPHKLLQNSYEDLGDISDTNKHYPVTKTKTLPVHTLNNPYLELLQLEQNILNDLSSGLQPQNIAVLALDSQSALWLKQRDFAKHVPFALQLSTPLSQILPINSSLIPHGPSLIQHFKEQNPHALQKIRALNTVEDTWKQFEFNDSILSKLSGALSAKNKKDYLYQFCEQVTLPNENFEEQMVITDLRHIHSFSDRKIYVLGLCLENLTQTFESQLYTPYLYTQPEFAEHVQSPSYCLQIALEQLKQLLERANNIHLSQSVNDHSGRPTTPLDLGSNIQFIHQKENIAKQDLPTQLRTSDYYKTKKHHFSVTELQEYQNCPYRYYARYHLNLGNIDKDDLEPGGDVKGNFVHNVLYRLIKENEVDYREGLEYQSYREKIIAKLGQVIQQEIEKTPEFASYQQSVIDFYAYRVYKTVIALMQIEAGNFKEKKKRTMPRHYEWGFGQDSRNSFTLKTKHGPIQLRGRIDRIDVHAGSKNFTVIDYKTGNLPPISDLKSGKSLQLPVYLMVVQKLLYPDHQPSSACFYGLKENSIKGFTIADTADQDLVSKRSRINAEEWNAIEESLVARIEETISQIYAGEFAPQPTDESGCQFCDYKRICGYFSDESN